MNIIFYSVLDLNCNQLHCNSIILSGSSLQFLYWCFSFVLPYLNLGCMKIQIDSDFLKPESKFRRSFLNMLDLLYMAQRDSVAKFDLISLDID